MPVRFLFLLAAVLSVANPATAKCLVENDIKKGVVLTRDNLFSTLYRENGGLIEEQRIMSRGKGLEPVSAKYVHALLPSERVSAKGRQEIFYSGEIRLARLPELEVWKTNFILRDHRKMTAEGRVELRFLDFDKETVAECSYRVWKVRVTTTMINGVPIIFDQYYAPDLNLVLRSVRVAEDGTSMSEVRFDRAEIRSKL